MVQGNDAGSSPGSRGRALRRRDIVGLTVMLAVVGVVVALVIRSPAAATAPGGAATTHSSTLKGLAVVPVKPAPPLALRNYLGTPINIDSYRGKAVLVTFLYTHCPDVCPLITSMMHTALERMSASEQRQVQIIAVSVDPRGDNPTTVAQFLTAHEMVGRMQYLIGSAAALSHVWATWGVSTQRDSNPELVAHSALIYGITGHGKIAAVYPSNFTASEIIHDVPLLARA